MSDITGGLLLDEAGALARIKERLNCDDDQAAEVLRIMVALDVAGVGKGGENYLDLLERMANLKNELVVDLGIRLEDDHEQGV